MTRNFIIYFLFAITMLSCTSIYKSHYDKPNHKTVVVSNEWVMIGSVEQEDSLNSIELIYSPALPKDNDKLKYKFKPEIDTIKCISISYNKALNSYRFISSQFDYNGTQLDSPTNVQIKKVLIKK